MATTLRNQIRIPVEDGPGLMDLMLAEHDPYPKGLLMKLRGAHFKLVSRMDDPEYLAIMSRGHSGMIVIVILGVSRKHPGSDEVTIHGKVHAEMLSTDIRVHGTYSVRTRKGSFSFHSTTW